MDSINDTSTLVQVMVGAERGDKRLPEPMLAQFTDAHLRHQGWHIVLFKLNY